MLLLLHFRIPLLQTDTGYSDGMGRMTSRDACDDLEWEVVTIRCLFDTGSHSEALWAGGG